MRVSLKEGEQLARLLAYVTGLANQELLLQNEYLSPHVLRSAAPDRCAASNRRTPIWAMLSPIKRWVMCFGVTASHPAPKRSQRTTWKEFIAAHMTVLAGIDFFTVEVANEPRRTVFTISALVQSADSEAGWPGCQSHLIRGCRRWCLAIRTPACSSS
jgi:hypothetical protein